MRARTSALVTLAAAAVALGVAVPAFAMSGSPDPVKGLADAPGSGRSVVDWNRQLITILGTPNAQPATIHPTRSFAILQAAEYDAVVSITRAAPPYKATLTNNARPDCVVHLPDGPFLVIDAKFPLEAVTAFREAKSEDDRKLATARVRSDIAKHVGDIASKYLIPGETQDMALMFVPSESIYAELYDGFDDIFQKAYRAKVIIVSPSLLMLAIQVIQQIRRDARMREAAGKILIEVGLLVADVSRLRDRVENLDKHFGQANADIKQIVISADKVVSRGERIRDVEFADEPPSAEVLPGPGVRRLEAGE